MIKLKYLILLSVSGSIIALDQLTKQIVVQKFFLNETYPVIQGIFDLTHVRNPGAAFGMLSRLDASVRIPFFIIVPLIALGVIGYLFRKLEETEILMAFALSMVIGGAIGNLIDRAAYNYVIDFLLFHWQDKAHYPAFNIADAGICVGVAFLVFDTIRKERKARRASHSV